MKCSSDIFIPSTFQKILKIPIELYLFWNGFFMVLLAHHKEPILISGPSSFKKFLASSILQTTPVIMFI
jgi:hypothetical protein